MFSKEDLRYTLALLRVPGLGVVSVKRLLNKLGSAKAVFEEKKSNLAKIDGIGLARVSGFNLTKQLAAADDEVRFIEENQIGYSFFLDSSYPDRLRFCPDSPVLLFHKGKINLKQKRIISVVGTRKITSYGRSFCREILEELAPLNPVVVSGMAYGVDICAHRAALDFNLQTIGCLAHGFNQMYPKEHEVFAEKMLENGGFFSEFWSTDTFDKTNFLRRNRIIAGLSEATIVIESAKRGGSLVTADLAFSYNREVFAVPGRVHDKQSQGCNNLIKFQKAHVLTTAADIVYQLGWELEDKPKTRQTQLFAELDEDEKRIYDFLLGKDKELIDSIAIECGFPVHKTATVLMNMELKGVINPLPGKFFEII